MKFIQFLILVFPIILLSQRKPFDLQGTLLDENDLLIEYASIRLQHLKIDSISYGAFSNENGAFSLNVRRGKYQFTVEAIGYDLYQKEIMITSNQNLGELKLKIVDGISLGEAEIVGEKPLYRIELDKKVYDLERDQTTRGQSLSDALNNVPSVQVDGEGTVSVRGNENVRFLINGKPSALVGISDPAEALRNLPADAVKHVEVITNPSARYDAEGSAGIINIVMKKGVKTGFNGSVNTFIGYRINTGVNASLNYKTKKWNFFFTPSIRYSEPKGNSMFNNTFFTDGVVDSIQTQDGNRFRNRFNTTINLGAEYDLNKNTTISLSGFYRFSDGENERNLFRQDFLGTSNLIAQSTRDEIEDETDDNYEATFGINHSFNNDGHEISLQTSTAYSEEDELADIVETVILGNDEAVFDRSTNNEAQNRYLIQLDYVFPFKKGALFEAGYKSEIVQNRNDVLVETIENGVPIVGDLFTGFTKNQQDVHAFYTQYGNKFGKFSFIAGLRLEITDIEILNESAFDSNLIDKDFNDLFPSLTLNYVFDEKEKNQLQLSYSRRIRRPFSRFLNPFFSFADDRNTFRGNPDLNPTYTDSFEAGFITEIGKVSVNPAIYYQSSDDVVNFFRRTQDITFGSSVRNFFVTNPVNVGTIDRYGAELIVSAKPFKIWRFFTNLNLFRFEQEGIFVDNETGDEFDFSGNGFTWFARVNNTFNLPGKVDFQVNANYRGPQDNAQADRDGIFNLDLALAKDLFNDKATLTLNVSDVFNSRKRRITSFGSGFESDIEFQFRETQVTLNFAYRFNQKKKRERQRSSGFDGGDVGGF